MPKLIHILRLEDRIKLQKLYQHLVNRAKEGAQIQDSLRIRRDRPVDGNVYRTEQEHH